MESDQMQNLLAALVEQARALATRLAGDPDQETNCHFCAGALPLWENMLVLQLTGVAAHVQCPEVVLGARLSDIGPDTTFPYAEFSQAVDQRMELESPTSVSGIIHC